MNMAVWPVSRISGPLSASMSFATPRRDLTRSLVSSSAGPVLGTTFTMAVSLALLGETGPTDSTPGSFSMRLRTLSASALTFSASMVTISGPLKPLPKESDIMSYALRWVVSGAMVPSLGRPSFMLAAGTATAPRPTTASSRTATGLRRMKRAQRAPRFGCCCLRARSSALRCFFSDSGLPLYSARSLRASTLTGAKPRSAGTSVTAMKTAIATVPAAAMPIFVSIGMLTTARPTRAMMTVSPAKTTAVPAVPTARPAASWRSRPSAISER